jgi:hypothetical protein
VCGIAKREGDLPRIGVPVRDGVQERGVKAIINCPQLSRVRTLEKGYARLKEMMVKAIQYLPETAKRDNSLINSDPTTLAQDI